MRRTAATVALLLPLSVSGPVVAQSGGTARPAGGPGGPILIEVTGQGRASAAADVGEVVLGVVREGANLGQTLATNNEAMAALLALLKQRGVAERDTQTVGLSIQPTYATEEPAAGGRRPLRIVGYRVSNLVRLVARDLPKLGGLLDEAVRKGGNELYGVNFRVGDTGKLEDEARRKALADARHRASLYADDAGLVLGPPKSIQEGGPPGYPRAAFAPMMAPAPAAPSEVPVAAGEHEVTVSVSVVYTATVKTPNGPRQ
jgi:uncharacterized protein YggE